MQNETLSHYADDMIRTYLLLALLLSTACQSRRWSPADQQHPNRMRSCMGEILTIDSLEDGGLRLQIEPRSKDKVLLAKEQMVMNCDIPADYVTRFKVLVANLTPGQKCEIHGWFVRDNNTGLHHLRPVTSVDPYPDSKPPHR